MQLFSQHHHHQQQQQHIYQLHNPKYQMDHLKLIKHNISNTKFTISNIKHTIPPKEYTAKLPITTPQLQNKPNSNLRWFCPAIFFFNNFGGLKIRWGKKGKYKVCFLSACWPCLAFVLPSWSWSWWKQCFSFSLELGIIYWWEWLIVKYF